MTHLRISTQFLTSRRRPNALRGVKTTPSAALFTSKTLPWSSTQWITRSYVWNRLDWFRTSKKSANTRLTVTVLTCLLLPVSPIAGSYLATSAITQIAQSIQDLPRRLLLSSLLPRRLSQLALQVPQSPQELLQRDSPVMIKVELRKNRC